MANALKYAGMIQAGNTAAKAGTIKQRQLERSADASKARATRESAEIQRQGDLIKSDASAAMAASGGVTDDPGAIEQMTKIQQVVDYNALSAIYEGDVEAQQKRYAGKVARWEGKTAKQAKRLEAISTALSDASSAYAAGGK